MDLRVALKQLGQQLGPTEDSKTFGRQKVDEVFRIIRENSGELSFDRFVFVGGAGQKTSCWANMDFDCVVYVNMDQSWWSDKTIGFDKKLDTLRKKVLTHWKSLLQSKLDKSVDIQFDDFLCTLHWKREGVKVDLLTAPNALNHPNFGTRGESQNSDLQVRNMHLALRGAVQGPNQATRMLEISGNFTFSVSVMERSVDMMKMRDSTAHEVARLAKLWMLICCPIKRRVRGLSVLVSIIATR